MSQRTCSCWTRIGRKILSTMRVSGRERRSSSSCQTVFHFIECTSHLIKNLECRGKDIFGDGVDITYSDRTNSHEEISERQQMFFPLWISFLRSYHSINRLCMVWPVFPINHSFVLWVKFSPEKKGDKNGGDAISKEPTLASWPFPFLLFFPIWQAPPVVDPISPKTDRLK